MTSKLEQYPFILKYITWLRSQDNVICHNMLETLSIWGGGKICRSLILHMIRIFSEICENIMTGEQSGMPEYQ